MGERIDLLARIQELQKENKQLKEENEILKDKATPKKVIVDSKFNTHCPNCNEIQVFGYYQINNKYCPHCGQAIDWSDEDE